MNCLKDKDLSKLKVSELKHELIKRNISVKGLKSDLVKRLETALGRNVAIKQEKDGTKRSKTNNNEDSGGGTSTKVPNCYNSEFQRRNGHAYAGSLFSSEIYECVFDAPVKEENIKAESETEEFEQNDINVKEELDDDFEIKMDVKAEVSSDEEYIKLESPDSINLKSEMQENDEDEAPEVLSVADEDEDEEEVVVDKGSEAQGAAMDIEEIYLDDDSQENSEEIDETLEMELLRGDTPAFNSANNSVDQTGAGEAPEGGKVLESVPDNGNSGVLNEPDEIVIPDSPDPAPVEEVLPRPIQIIIHENSGNNNESPKSPSDSGNPATSMPESPKSASDRRPRSPVSYDDNDSFIRLDVGNDNDLYYLHEDFKEEDNASVVLEEESNENEFAERDIPIGDAQSATASRRNSVTDRSRRKSQSHDSDPRAGGYFIDRRRIPSNKDPDYHEKIRKDLEERQLRDLKRKEENLKVLERKQRYEAERLEREKQKILKEKEKLAKEKNELIRKELELEKQALQRKQKELQMERLKLQCKTQEESSRLRDFQNSGIQERDNFNSRINLSHVNSSNRDFDYRRDFPVNSVNRYESTGNSSYSDYRRHCINRSTRNTPQPIESTNRENFDHPNQIRNFYYGSLNNHGRGANDTSTSVQSLRNRQPEPSNVNRNNFPNDRFEPPGGHSRSRSKSRARSRSRSRSGSSHRNFSRSRSRSRPNYSRSRSKSRYRSRSKSSSIVDITEQGSFNPGSQRDEWVSDEETDRYGNPRPCGRRQNNFRNNTENFRYGARPPYDDQNDFTMPSASVVGVNPAFQGPSYYQNQFVMPPGSMIGGPPERTYNDNNFDTRSMVDYRGNFGNPQRNNSNYVRRGSRPFGRTNPTFSRNFNGNSNSTYGKQNDGNLAQTNDNRRFNHFQSRGRRPFNNKSYKEPDSSSYWK